VVADSAHPVVALAHVYMNQALLGKCAPHAIVLGLCARAFVVAPPAPAEAEEPREVVLLLRRRKEIHIAKAQIVLDAQ